MSSLYDDQRMHSSLSIPIRSRRVGLVDVIGRCCAWIAKEWRIHRDTRTLLEFDDRELADLGLQRGQIEYAVRHGRLPSLSGDDPCR